MFVRNISDITVEESVRVGKHLTDKFSKKIVYSVRPNDMMIKHVQEGFQILKLKIYSDLGEIIYSTKKNEIGKRTNDYYFFNHIAKGKIYSKVVKRDEKTLDGVIISRDVVEIYIPVMKDGKAKAKIISEQCVRMMEIINHLRTFGRETEKKDWKEVDLNIVADQAINILSHRLKSSNVLFKTYFCSRTPIIRGDANLFESIIQNFITNSCGISRKNLQNIFDPFFTTKSEDKGTGLGLSIVCGIVENFGGTIACDSSEGEGEEFKIKFPSIS